MNPKEKEEKRNVVSNKVKFCRPLTLPNQRPLMLSWPVNASPKGQNNSPRERKIEVVSNPA
jgi:hypothetical protein